jgi:hypothetical protein
VSSSVKIGITAQSYPKRKLLEEVFNYIKLEVLKTIAKHFEGPKFA